MNKPESVVRYLQALNRLQEIDHQQALLADVQAQQLLQHIGDVDQPLNILDIGCGDGFVIHLLSHALCNASITGVDHSAEHIAFAKELTPEQDFTTKAYPDFEYLKDSFDIVYSSLTLHHTKPFNYKHFVRIMNSYLRPGGVGIILEINPWNRTARREFKNNPEEKTSVMIWPWQLKKMVKQYGPASLYFYHLFTRNSSIFSELEYLLSWIPLGQLYALSWIKEDEEIEEEQQSH